MLFLFTEGKQSRAGGTGQSKERQSGTVEEEAEQGGTGRAGAKQGEGLKRFTLTNGLLFFSLSRWERGGAKRHS